MEDSREGYVLDTARGTRPLGLWTHAALKAL